MTRSDLRARVEKYAQRHDAVIIGPLGAGVQGSVFHVSYQYELRGTAVKAMLHEVEYRREKSVYLRLKEHGVETIRGCHVPELVANDDELQILEMSMVQRPFVLDFGGAYLDYPPDFSDEVLAEWEREKREQYGDRWPEVQAILRELEKFDIYMVDVNPGNISFAAE